MTKKKPEPKVKSHDDTFEELTQDLIDEMEQVDCPMPVYLEGLRAAERMIRERIAQVVAEIDADG